MIPAQRLGVAGTWVVAICIIFGLRAVGLEAASGIAGAIWLAFVIYSWTAAPAIVRYLERRGP